jgi:FkbM family methyltransferase
MYSQNNEDTIIMDYFKGSIGNLLDIGAYDGSSGTLVEPLPAAAEKCRQLYQGNPTISVQEYAIGPENRRITFHASEMMSTIDAVYELHRRKWHSLTFTDVEVEQITLDTLWTLVGRSFDFVSIDVENYNIDLARQLPPDVWRRVRCLCIEHDGHVDEIQRLASQYGLDTIGYNGENLILASAR